MADFTLGFIGLGVMGEPMCRHLVLKSGRLVRVSDLNPDPVARLVAAGATTDDVSSADIVFISVPSGEHLRSVCEGPSGLFQTSHKGQTIVDLSTSPLKLTRDLAEHFSEKGVEYADAPVARTRAAAEAGTLALTVGGTEQVFERIEPFLRCFASEVTHCGPVGAGQVVKILNNMVVVGTVMTLCEAAAIAETAGIDRTFLFDTFSKASADSFALRNHGMKAIAARSFPEKVFPTDYMLKDMTYALEMAAEAGIDAKCASLGAGLLSEASRRGFGAEYWPTIVKLIETKTA